MQKVHLKAQDNWMNDPNGFIYYKGCYHLFYQCFPYAPRWGRMHWGHAVSKDLVSWEDRGIALFPSKRDDRDGCFSGSAIEHDGKLYLYYTGVRYLQENPDDTNLCLDEQFVSAQMLVTSQDGVHFDNIADKKTMIPVLTEAAAGDARHTRDPKVWEEDGTWYMVLGSTRGNRHGQLLFYKSTDAEHWSFANFATKEDGFGWMWECPDYFRTNGAGVLVFSPMGFLTDGKGNENQSICMLVDFDRETCTMTLPDTYQFLDYGLDLYAPQSTVDAQGRRVLIAWLRMPEPVDGRWWGMQCIPRVVEVKNGHIYFRPHPNIKHAFSRQIETPQEADADGYRLNCLLGDGGAVHIGGYRIYREGRTICTDKSALHGKAFHARTVCTTPELKEGFALEVYVDKNLIEVFVNDGEAVISNAVYETGDNITTEGDVQRLSLHTLDEQA